MGISWTTSRTSVKLTEQHDTVETLTYPNPLGPCGVLTSKMFVYEKGCSLSPII